MENEGRRQLDAAERGLRSIVTAIAGSLSDAERDEISEYLDAGEYGIALEWMADCIAETTLEISQSVFAIIESLAIQMRLEDKVITPALRNCVRTADHTE